MNYRYQKNGIFLLPYDLSVSKALTSFWFGYERLGLGSLGVSRKIAKRLLKANLAGKFRPVDPERIVTLPVSAMLGMQVHNGYKMFDFEKNQVTKIFNADFSAEQASAEIGAVKQASCILAAPRFIGADENSRWFTEEYIRGKHATDLVSAGSSDYLQFYKDAEKCLLDLQASQTLMSRSVDEHLRYLVETPFRDRWLVAGVPAAEIDEVAMYQQKLQSWIRDNAEIDPLQLVATHGDFSLVNAIAAESGLRFIDWESVSPGCMFTDVYNFALVEQYYERSSLDFPEEVRQILQKFRAATVATRTDLAGSVELSDCFVRRLYFLERLRFLLDRDVTANLRRVTRKSVDLFRQFDADMGDSPF